VGEVAFFTPAEVGDRLRLGKVDSVYALIHSGALAAVDVGTGSRPTWRIPAAALDKFLADRRAVPAPAAKPRRARRPTQVTRYF
jgi:excisionase family DNA binding protein